MNNDNDTILLIIGAITAVIYLLLIYSFIRYSTTRGGEHSGYVTAIEQNGLFFHNYTVYFKTDNSSSQEDRYCVQEIEVELAKELREANKSRRQVTIHYEGVREFGINLCKGEKIVELLQKQK